jgi:hypothetical protein
MRGYPKVAALAPSYVRRELAAFPPRAAHVRRRGAGCCLCLRWARPG